MKSIYLDANILIFAFERQHAEGAYIWPVLEAIEAGRFVAKSSLITLAEVLTGPLKLGQMDLAANYEDLFRSRSIFEPVPVTLQVLSEAAHIRAQRWAIPLPDAIHLATALISGCTAFLTADKRLLSFNDLAMVPASPTCLAEVLGHLA